MDSMEPFASGNATADSLSPRKAMVAFLTIIEDKLILNFGPGNSTCERWEISRRQLRDIALTATAELWRDI